MANAESLPLPKDGAEIGSPTQKEVGNLQHFEVYAFNYI